MKTENKSIIIVGMPGSGKTTVSRLIAQKTGFELIDTDELIEKSQNKKITQIFKENGESFFRELETELIKTLKPSETVISTGGGMVQEINNMALLKKIGVVFYLDITPEKIYERIKDDKTRPLLLCENPLSEIKKLYNKRKNNFETADYTVNADNSPIETADKVIELYENVIG